MRSPRGRVVLLMGVSGVGKTTIGRLLANALGWKFLDADDYHPSANVEKMRRGEPLSESDRLPWLEKLQDLLRSTLEAADHAVLACSALRRRHRDILLIDDRVQLVYLKGAPDLIHERLIRRPGHFMNPLLLASQFSDLEEPEAAFAIEVNEAPAKIVRKIIDHLRGTDSANSV